MPKKYLIVAILLIASLFLELSTSHAQDAAPTIAIPSIQVAAPIVSAYYSPELRTWDVSHLYMTVGHMEFTPWFGMNGGNIVLGAHSETAAGEPDIFYNLRNVQIGDEIVVTVGGTNYVYRVVQTKVISARDTSILRPNTTETLTLFTCDIASYADGKYTHRNVVVAERVG